MSATPNRQAAILGLFIAAGLVLLVGGLFAIGNLRDGLSADVRVSVDFDDVNGLKKGDAIWFSGVRVGKVEDVRFTANNQVHVDLAVKAEHTKWIPDDSRAKVGSDGLIGSTIVVLYDGRSKQPLEAGDVLRPGETVTAEQLMGQFQKTNENLFAITTDLRAVSGTVAAGEGSVGRLLDDDQLYQEVTATVANLQGASKNAQRMTADLAKLSRDMNREGSLAHELANDTTTYGELTDSVGSLKTTAGNAANLVGDLQGKANDPNTPVGVLLSDSKAGSDLAATLENLSQGTDKLSDTMDAAQNNFLLRGYFKKQEKKARKEEEARQEDLEQLLEKEGLIEEDFEVGD